MSDEQTRLVDVVATRREAEELEHPPLVVTDTVEAYLDAQGLGRGPLEISRIGEGQSNATFRVRRDGADLVLRRGPRPPIPKSTHDMLREARVQSALAERGFPVPRLRAVCEDESLLGVPFYVMDRLDGVVVTDRLPEGRQGAEDKRRVGDLLVGTLAQLHAVDTTEGPVARLGKPEGYLERQLRTFTGLWEHTSQREVPQVAEVSDRLSRGLPATQRPAVIHGDYRLGNLMLAPDGRSVQAVLDWEMSTLGDPLADLGYLAATYAQPGDEGSVLELSSVTRDPAFPSREEIVEDYARRTGLDVSDLPWYEALALFKAGVFSEAIYTRWRNGEAPEDTRFAESLEDGVPDLFDRALAALEEG